MTRSIWKTPFSQSQIFKSIKSLSKTEKESSYNRMLGKKFLWDNYNPTKARNYILKSIKLKIFK